MKKVALTILIVLAAAANAYAADLTAGLDALRSKDYNSAVENLQPLANDGNTEAAYRMCGMYYLGHGVPKNDAEAARLCHIAAERGHPDAMYNLALMYQKGEGVGQDMTEATRWYSSAAAKGHPDARFNLKQIELANTPGTNVKALELVHNAAANLRKTPPAQQQQAAPPAQATAQPAAQPNVWPPVEQQQQQQQPQQQPPQATAQTQPPKAAVKTTAKPVAKTVTTPPPVPPQPPVPPEAVPGVEQITPAPPVMPQPPVAPIAPADVLSNDRSSTSPAAPDLVKYCVMAAQRGNPDPGCASVLAPPKPKKVEPVEPATEIKEPMAPVKPVAPTLPPVKPEAPTPPTVKPEVKPVVKKPVKKVEAKPFHNFASAKSPFSAAEAPSIATSLIIVNRPSLMPPQAEKQFMAKPAEKVTERNLKWYIAQANTGNPQAQNNLGVMYRRGLSGAPKNIPESVKWFERAASQGSVNGMLNLASIYKVGEGSQQNLELAYAWYNLASDRLPRSSEKRQKAQQNVKEIAKYLTNEQIGDALQYVTQLDENLPVLNEPLTAEDEPSKP